MVKIPFKRKRKKNPFEASMPLDKPEVKMVEARYKKKPFLVAFGVAEQRDVKGAGGIGTEGVKGEYQSQKDLNWRVLYNLGALPSGFIPEEKLKDWMAGTVAVTSGSIDVFNPNTQFIETEEKRLEEVDNGMWTLDPEEVERRNLIAFVEMQEKKKKRQEEKKA